MVSQIDIHWGHNLSVMHSDTSQPSTCSSSRLTMVALFEVKLQFVKVPLLPLPKMWTAPPCKQVDRTTQPHIQIHTQKQQSVHAFIHSFIHSFNPPYSLYHSFTRTNDASPLPFITIINHQPCIARTTKCGIHTCTHDVTMTRTQWNAFACIPLANHHLTEIHICMHALRLRLPRTHWMCWWASAVVAVVAILTTE